VLRGVLERTRGDMTLSLRQQRLQNALARAEKVALPPAPPLEEVRRLLLELSQSLQVAAPAGQHTPLAALRDEVQEALTESATPPTLRTRLESALMLFESDHPELTLRIQAVINALSNAGV
jgi:hypothetical protein